MVEKQSQMSNYMYLTHTQCLKNHKYYNHGPAHQKFITQQSTMMDKQLVTCSNSSPE